MKIQLDGSMMEQFMFCVTFRYGLMCLCLGKDPSGLFGTVMVYVQSVFFEC